MRMKYRRLRILEEKSWWALIEYKMDVKMVEECFWPPSLIQIHEVPTVPTAALTSKMGTFETRGYG
jgi:hypothetical protein